MRSEIEDYIRQAYPSGTLAEYNKNTKKKYDRASDVTGLLEACHGLAEFECQNQSEDDEDRARIFMIYTPSLTYWNREFHGQSPEKRLKIIHDHGTYANMTVYVSCISPCFYYSWTCFDLKNSQKIEARFSPIAPSKKWISIKTVLQVWAKKYNRILMNSDEVGEKAPWMNVTGTYLEDLKNGDLPTVFHCLFDIRL